MEKIKGIPLIKIFGMSYQASITICKDCMSVKDWINAKSEEERQKQNIEILTESSITNWDQSLLCDGCVKHIFR